MTINHQIITSWDFDLAIPVEKISVLLLALKLHAERDRIEEAKREIIHRGFASFGQPVESLQEYLENWVTRRPVVVLWHGELGVAMEDLEIGHLVTWIHKK